MQLAPFHLAVQVRDIKEARYFHGVKMGFPEGRSAWNLKRSEILNCHRLPNKSCVTA